MISIIKAKLSFFGTLSTEGHGFHGNKGTILFSSSVNFPISAISTKLYFVELVEYIKSYRYLTLFRLGFFYRLKVPPYDLRNH